MGLHDSILTACRAFPDRQAIREPSGAVVSYAELDRLSGQVRDQLAARGVRRGDRVGVYLPKSADSIVAFLGILRAGAGYVPLDPQAPSARNASILESCGARVVIVERRLVEGLRDEPASLGAVPELIVLDEVGQGAGIRGWVEREAAARTVDDARVADHDLAYILYTSGSTGKPKGVTLSHLNACSFVEWCRSTFRPTCEDRFSAHAPFHFDLSILDLWLSLSSGATVCVIDEVLGKDPHGLSAFIAEAGVSIWYSAPSILSLISARGEIGRFDHSGLRLVLFAGEVFPIAALRALKAQWPRPRYFNLYGPTETNVCTYYELPPGPVPESRVDSYPIGKVCEHLRALVADSETAGSTDGSELCIAGPAVTAGYWGEAELTERAFLRRSDGPSWYRTGDLVSVGADGEYVYRGRRDRMIKKRGYRVELGEIESCLYRHDLVREAAVLALPDDELGVRVRAHLATRDGGRISVVSLKQFCARHLPVYMIPDQFSFHDALPKTSTDKTDYQALRNIA